ncbi:MAG: hypothetical protein PVG41_13190 [Desulfobacteraceae bacterium]
MDEPIYTLEEQNGSVRVTFKIGHVVTPWQIMEAIALEYKRYDVSRYNTLWDFRGCLLPEVFGYNEIEQIIHYIDAYFGSKWNPRIAILVAADVQFGLSRMFQILVEGFPTEVAIFYSRAEAEQWIGQTP